MPRGQSYEFKGGKELAQLINMLGKDGVRLADKSLRFSMRPVRKTARQLAPKDTGQLRKSIVIKKKKGTKNIRKYVVVTTDPKAHLIELGVARHTISLKRKSDKQAMKVGGDFVKGEIDHPGIAAKPFLRPALEQNVQIILKEFSEKTESELENFVKKHLGPLGLK